MDKQEAIKILKEFHDKSALFSVRTALETVLPELKESEDVGEYKVKYTQEVLEKHVNNMSNKDDERLRKTTISFLKDFAKQGYENAVECIDWLEKQGEKKPVWSEKDDGYKLVALSAFLNYYDEENPLRKCLINWLKSLKQRMGG